MRRMTGFFGTALVVYGAMVGAMVVFQRSLMYFPPSDRPEIAAAGLPGLELVSHETHDGLVLDHWYHPPREPDGPVIVLFHGNAGHIGDRAAKYRSLFKAGFGVFLAEYRGYGGNPGSPSEEAITADARLVLDQLAARGVGPERIVLYGESLGTGVAVKMAAEWAVAGLVLEAPPGSVAEVAQAHYWYVPAKWLIWDRWDVIPLLASLRVPLLVLHGENDATVPIRFGRRVYEAAGGEKEAVFQPGGGHVDLYNYSGVPERVIGFVRRTVPRTGS